MALFGKMFFLKMLVWYGYVLQKIFKLICDGEMCLTTYLIMACPLSDTEQIYVHSVMFFVYLDSC